MVNFNNMNTVAILHYLYYIYIYLIKKHPLARITLFGPQRKIILFFNFQCISILKT